MIPTPLDTTVLSVIALCDYVSIVICNTILNVQ